MKTLSKKNCVANLWYSEFAEMWHWTIYFNPASHQEFHFNGNAPEEGAAKQDIVNTLAFIEQTYPTQEFFDSLCVPWDESDIALD
jgi:hypothetical protein